MTIWVSRYFAIVLLHSDLRVSLIRGNDEAPPRPAATAHFGCTKMEKIKHGARQGETKWPYDPDLGCLVHCPPLLLPVQKLIPSKAS